MLDLQRSSHILGRWLDFKLLYFAWLQSMSCSPTLIETHCVNLLLRGSRSWWEPFFNEIVDVSHHSFHREVLYFRFSDKERAGNPGHLHQSSVNIDLYTNRLILNAGPRLSAASEGRPGGVCLVPLIVILSPASSK